MAGVGLDAEGADQIGAGIGQWSGCARPRCGSRPAPRNRTPPRRSRATRSAGPSLRGCRRRRSGAGGRLFVHEEVEEHVAAEVVHHSAAERLDDACCGWSLASNCAVTLREEPRPLLGSLVLLLAHFLLEPRIAGSARCGWRLVPRTARSSCAVVGASCSRGSRVQPPGLGTGSDRPGCAVAGRSPSGTGSGAFVNSTRFSRSERPHSPVHLSGG